MLRDTSEKAREELNEIRESLKLKQGGWALFKINRNVRRAVFLGTLLGDQQFTGMNIIMYYAPRIFKMAGFTTHRTTDDCDSGRGTDLYVRDLHCGLYGR